MSYKISISEIAGWAFGLVVAVVGLINIFWGNDQLFGVFIFLVSFAYFPPINTIFRNLFGFSIPVVLKIILAILIIWASMGVGELLAKIDMMMADL